MDASPQPQTSPPDLSLTLTLQASPSHTAGSPQTSGGGSCLTDPPTMPLKPAEPPTEERGLRLIQLLVSCAHHVFNGGSQDLQLADYCLRLLTPMTSPTGDSMQRLAARLAAALSSRLLRQIGCLGALSAIRGRHLRGGGGGMVVPRDLAQLSFSRTLPYLTFARAVAASALLRALAGYRLVHVVQIGRPDPDLLAHLLVALARLPQPPAHVRFSSVVPPAPGGAYEGVSVSGNHHAVSLDQMVGSALAKEAESLGVPFAFRFHHVTVPLDHYLADASLLSQQEGEALAFVSVLTLHTLLAAEGKLDRVLSSLLALRPKAVVAVEQDADHDAARMPDRFAEALHHYGALFDSLDAAAGVGIVLPDERAAVEDMLGEELENIVACEGVDRVQRHQTAEKWVARFRSAGFAPLGGVLWAEEAAAVGRRVVEGMGFAAPEAEYGVVVRRGCPTICWHGRPMYAVSAWTT